MPSPDGNTRFLGFLKMSKFFDHGVGFDDFFQSHFLSPKMLQNMFLSPESDSSRFKRLSLTFWVIFEDFEFFRYISGQGNISARNGPQRNFCPHIFSLYNMPSPVGNTPFLGFLKMSKNFVVTFLVMGWDLTIFFKVTFCRQKCLKTCF